MTGGGPACPSCGSTTTKEVKYTWWGGLLGPKLFNLQACESCKFQFNRVTGKSTKNAVIAYNLVFLAIALVIVFFARSAF